MLSSRWVPPIGCSGDSHAGETRVLDGEAATAVLLLVDVAQQRAGVRGARDDADLGKASEVFVLVHDPPPAGGPIVRYDRERMGQVIPFPKRPDDDRDRSALVEVHRCDQREALVVKGLFESEGIPVLL